MISNDQLDNNIKQVISSELEQIHVPNDMYLRIEENIKKKNGKFIFRYGSNLKKTVLAFSFCLAILVSVSLTFSPTVRAIAANTVDAIKTIFVVEGTEDNYKVVEKDVSEAKMAYSVCTTTSLNDEEITKMLGYKVSFPQALSEEFTLIDKSMGLALGKELDYLTAQSLQNSMLKAINDTNEFEKLAEYNPSLNVFATYKSSSGKTIFISVDKATSDAGLQDNYGNVKIGEFPGMWIEFPYANYPGKTVDGVYGSDMTQKPKSIKNVHSLSWTANGVRYILHSNANEDFEPTLEEAITLAETFMKNQK